MCVGHRELLGWDLGDNSTNKDTLIWTDLHHLPELSAHAALSLAPSEHPNPVPEHVRSAFKHLAC